MCCLITIVNLLGSKRSKTEPVVISDTEDSTELSNELVVISDTEDFTEMDKGMFSTCAMMKPCFQLVLLVRMCLVSCT